MRKGRCTDFSISQERVYNPIMSSLAIVHDWLNQIGGAEDVLAQMHAMYPNAPIYTSIYAPDKMPAAMKDWDIRTNWLDRLPGIHDHHQPYLPLYPLAFGGVDLGDYDVVLSNKSGFKLLQALVFPPYCNKCMDQA